LVGVVVGSRGTYSNHWNKRAIGVVRTCKPPFDPSLR
jgi:hypothetical protein